MRDTYETEKDYAWIAWALTALMVGGLGGYIIAVQAGRTGPSVTAPPAAAATVPSTTIVDEAELRGYRDVLARDPKNADAAIRAGNLLYDGHRYVEAIPFYQQAFALRPSDINVSTDLGTALWYTGRADEALAQYDKSLAISPTHAQTLFNVGIVNADGTRNFPAAIAAWEKLLAANPTYPTAPDVRQLIAEARKKTAVTR